MADIYSIRFQLVVALTAAISSAAGQDAGSSTAPDTHRRGYIKGPAGIVIYDPEDKIETATIPLKTLDYATVEETCRRLLSTDGTMAYLDSRGVVFIRDKMKIIKTIRSLIEEMDSDPVNVSIRVDFQGGSSSSGSGVAVGLGGRPGAPVVIENGKINFPTSVSIGASNKSSKSINDNSMSLTVGSGRSGTLWVGSTVPDPAWLDTYFRRKTVILSQYGRPLLIAESAPPIIMRNVGAYLAVSPKARQNGLVELKLFPEISYIDGAGRRQKIRVESAAVELTVQSGQKTPIGGVLNSKSDSYRELFGTPFFGAGSSESRSVLDMYLTVNAASVGTVRPSAQTSRLRNSTPQR